MTSKAKVLIVTLALALAISPVVAANSGPGTIFKFGTDANSLSMGGAFVAVADNYSASYWNPAGLYQAKGLQLGGMNTQPYKVDGLNFMFGSASYSLSNFVVAGSYGRFSANLGDQVGYSSDAKHKETVMMGSLATGTFLPETVPTDVGVTVKQYRLAGETGIGFDVGLLMPFKGFTLGVLASDLNATVGGEQIAPTYRAGAALQPVENATVSAQIDLAAGERTLRAGMEYAPIKQLAIRGGVVKPQDQKYYFTAGGGLQLAGLSINAAWIQSKTQLGNTLVLSAGYSFGGTQVTKQAETATQG